MRFESEHATATVSLSRGGRLASLVVFGHELLITASDDADFGWGSFPMVPYAGRVAHGTFEFDGQTFTLPITMGNHAIHGTAWEQAWSAAGSDQITTDLGSDWPLGGTARQSIELADDHLDLTLTVAAGPRRMPAMVGWHPWFRRRLLSAPEAEAELSFSATTGYELDDMIPTGVTGPPGPGPWDDCFTGVGQPITVTWPGVVELALTSTCDHWVIYDRPEHALCVEPQSDAPDAFNRSPHVLEPGDELTHRFRLSWIDLRDSA